MLTEKNRHRKKDRETLKENRQRQTALIIQYIERNTSKENKNKSHTKNARERKPLKDRQRNWPVDPKHRFETCANRPIVFPMYGGQLCTTD